MELKNLDYFFCSFTWFMDTENMWSKLASMTLLQMRKIQNLSSWIFTLLMPFFISMKPKISTVVVNSKFPFTVQPHSIVLVWQPTMSIFQYFLMVKIMMIYAKILLSRKTPKSLQNMNWKNFHVASDHCIQKIAYKIGMDVDIATQK